MCASLLLSLAPAADLDAQGLRGTITEVLSGRPVAGAIVALLDSAGTTLVRGLSDGAGLYRIPFAPSAHRLRVIRIGFHPFEAPVAAGAGVDATYDVRLEPLPSLLAPIIVRANPGCPRRSDTERAFGLWTQARAALLATVVAREATPAEKRRIRYEQVFSGGAKEEVTRHTVRLSTESDSLGSFFAARSAGDFVRQGFMEAQNGQRTFFGPDAEVLLDDEFLLSYCLRLARPDAARADLAGLAFVPVKARRGIIDIDGVVWIDTIARSLREIAFRYRDLGRGTARFRPGGSISFLEMSNGVVLIDRWEFRLVGAQVSSRSRPVGLALSSLLYLDLTGGQLARASWPDGTVWQASLGTLRGRLILRDGRPAAGVPIALDDTDYEATTDSTGSFAITDLVAGPYVMILPEPRIESLGLRIPLGVRFTAVRDSTQYAALAVPTLEEYVADRCEASKQLAAGDSTYLLGRVFRDDGAPAGGLRVSFSVLAGSGEWETLPTHFLTGPSGVFQSCGTRYVPGNLVRVTVRQKDGTTTAVEHTITSRMSVVRVVIPE
ncbi:MAG: carboxypeptidase-like regulatory domain-containing protein [Gemmatimonadota bacterium]|nr:carboxypeptidase-like regulatory domain-containing protein [Gemmatimonadota bacterium]